MPKVGNLPSAQSRAIGKRMVELREKLELTQEQVADLIGLSKGAIGQYENGRTFPGLSTFVDLCRVYNCSADYLLHGSVTTSDFSKDIQRLIARLEGMPQAERDALFRFFGPALDDTEVEDRMPITKKTTRR